MNSRAMIPTKAKPIATKPTKLNVVKGVAKKAAPTSAKKNVVAKVSKPSFTPFNAADYLTDEATITAYLNAAMEDGDPALLLMALKNVAEARNMTRLAADAGIARASLYKALSPGAKPQMETILKVAGALGLRMSFQPA
jgi:probable addiction module antidote protein